MQTYQLPLRTSNIDNIRARTPGWFRLADDVALFANDVLCRFVVDTANGQQVLAAILFRRALSAFEGVILLGERGMHTEGEGW